MLIAAHVVRSNDCRDLCPDLADPGPPFPKTSCHVTGVEKERAATSVHKTTLEGS